MATVEEKNHDSSTTIGDHYDTVSDPDAGMTVIAGAALNSSTYGVKADYDAGTNLMYLRDTITGFSGNDLTLRVMFNFANLANSSGTPTIGTVVLDDTPTAHDPFSFSIRFNGTSTIEVAATVYDDAAGSRNIAGYVSVPTSGEVCLEIRAVKETSDGAADGTAEFYVDGVSQAQLTDVENFNTFDIFDRFHIGFTSNSATISGYLYYDELILDDSATAELGCSTFAFSGYDLVQGGGQP